MGIASLAVGGYVRPEPMRVVVINVVPHAAAAATATITTNANNAVVIAMAVFPS
jgi:hypothetical protein